MPNEFNEKLNEESIRARSFYTATVFWAHLAQPYSETCQTSKIECFVKIVDAWKPLTIYVKCSILDVWQGFWILLAETREELVQSDQWRYHVKFFIIITLFVPVCLIWVMISAICRLVVHGWVIHLYQSPLVEISTTWTWKTRQHQRKLLR